MQVKFVGTTGREMDIEEALTLICFRTMKIVSVSDATVPNPIIEIDDGTDDDIEKIRLSDIIVEKI
jgi:PHP family Zn ribbon phosphoesterase